MDGTAAIQSNLEALKRILAGLVAMAGLGCLSSPLAGEDGSARRGDLSAEAQRAKAEAEPLAEPGEGSGSRPTLPRHLLLAILRLLRPAEAAARRLIIASARGLVVALPPSRKRRPKPVSAEPFLRRFGIAVVMSPADIAAAAAARRAAAMRAARPRTLSLPKGSLPRGSLPLFDPLRRPFRPCRRYVPAHAAPRILSFDVIKPFPLPPPPSPDDPVDATRLNLRLAALAAALDDLPGQARRFARWKARQRRRAESPSPLRGGVRGGGNRRSQRISPLRSGRPPGGRLARFDPTAIRRRNIRKVDEILAHAHALALYALQYPDTS